MFSSRATLSIFLAAGVAAASGCATAGMDTTLQERIVTLQPTRTGALRSTDGSTTFGTCVGLEGRGRRSFTWDYFVGLERPEITGLAGYEVAISRGQTCHLRVVSTFQTLVEFDMNALPAGGVTRAELRAVSTLSRPPDAPVDPGTRSQCDVLVVGRATSPWAPGTSFGPRITWRNIPPPQRPFGDAAAFGPVDVTRAVRDWHDGGQTNQGFVITPREAAVEANAEAIEEENDGFVCDLMLGQFELDVTMLVR